MSEDQYLSDKAIYLLDQSVRSVFDKFSLTPMYGPADRYGVIEWLANVPDFDRYVPSGLDTSDVHMDVAVAAWPDSENTEAEYSAAVQVTIAARTSRSLARWAFPSHTLPDLQSRDTENRLIHALGDGLQSKRTRSAVLSVVSPENAPSDMTVIPLIEEASSPP